MLRRRQRKALLVGLVAIATAAAAGFVAWDQPDARLHQPVETQQQPQPHVPIETAHTLALLEQLEPAAPEATIPEYRREYFGNGWNTVDGCSVRNLVLERDLHNVTWLPDSNCIVATGTLNDPYTGQQLQFQHDAVATSDNPGSQGVQIDHIVSLRAAWFGGANTWSDSDRVEFANDTDNLIAVDGPANNGKNALGPAEWFVPANPDHRCDFATQFVTVMAKWEISINDTDRAALLTQLESCD